MAEDKNRSKLTRMEVRNIGCINNEGIEIALDKVVCLVGKNNAGKSTILRSYELAKGTINFDEKRDRNLLSSEEQISEIILDVHIPDGIANIDAAWKIDVDGLRIVRSRWQWLAPNYDKIRTTWNPKGGDNEEGDWDSEKKAAGLDNVFSARLPRPLRIGSLDDAEKTEEMLLTLALTPLIASLEAERMNSQSELSKAITSVTEKINGLSSNHEKTFNSIAEQVTHGFKGVFPSLGVHLNIGAAPFTPKIEDLVKKGSGLLIEDGEISTSLNQQGTGARRALFWSMLQVHNEMTRLKEIRDEFKKKLEKDLAEKKKKPKKETVEILAEYAEKLGAAEALLAAHNAGAPIPENPEDPSLPGYLLLIDEPENALHPMAARAAQRHLYKLGASPDWQVMMTTHSPYFINPFEDHTTVVRLERAGEDGKPISPKTYRSDHIEFKEDEKQRLQALQHIDPSFAEIFFGSYPVLVEGDTEHAAFMSSIIEKNHDLMDKITIIRARGKAILIPLIKVLKHFKIGFGIVHDCDPPYRKDGAKNGMWTENKKISDAVTGARESGIAVRHRVSIPDFERYLGGDEESKDKPLNAYNFTKNDANAGSKVEKLLYDLISSEQHNPFDKDKIQEDEDYLMTLHREVLRWAKENGMDKNTRFCGVDL
ncbi:MULTISPECIES: ATP-dependent endonuclease [unclassified Janthinobacterium]|uniref:ATP-dependent nuclease n=1 Tax=unclassified Janthinobacterium TaxID=2610881 RepID=UPI00087EBD95|nr:MULTISPECIES: AAA family ATPase [unclassified Janthinobacterium]SDA56266.1 AAA domain-containing protein, putative AbiEii toxin, Type IV TA system [Janthinobacterium sp. 551a]SFB48207.1 AAA domain-containing protein, putative AbiEii toxin, Type IV TA system [Janthinobacterium sp. 344]